MRSIKDYPLLRKLLIPLIAIGLALIADFFIVNYFRQKTNSLSFQEQLLMDVNDSHTDVLYCASEILQGNYEIKNRLQTVTRKQQDIYYLLSEGGMFSEEESEISVAPLHSDYDVLVDSLLKVQKMYMEFINVMMDEPLSTGEQEIQSANKQIKSLGIISQKYTDEIGEALRKSYRNAEQAQMLFEIIFMLFIAGAGVFIFFIFKQHIVYSLEKLISTLNHIYEGDISSNEIFLEKGNDEIGRSNVLINQIIGRLRKTAKFISDIGKEKFDTDYKSFGKDDVLGNSLKEIRENFIEKAEEENKRKVEDTQRNWINTGLNKFSDILRMHTDSLEELGYNVISNLVRYLDANQGGIFIYHNDEGDQHLNMIASIAYDRRKYIERRIEPGEGLLGTCLLEKDTIYLDNIPQEYIEIESGLGDANPKYLLITPLKIEEDLLGVIEIASFNELEEHQIAFIEEVGESIASTLSSSQMNRRTTQLLQQAQEQAEELHAQEEEMRQNMEELQATQEESDRKAEEMKNLLTAIDNSAGTLELDLEGYVISVNDTLLSVLNATKAQVVGMEHQAMVSSNFVDENEFTEIWEKLKEGTSHKAEYKVNIKIGEVWLDMTYTPVINENGEVQKILVLASNITLKKIQEMELQDNIDMLKMKEEQLQDKLQIISESSKELEEKEKVLEEKLKLLDQENKTKDEIIEEDIEYSKKVLEASHQGIITIDIDGRIEFFNKAAQIISGYALDEIIGKEIGIIVAENQEKFFESLKEKSGSGLEVTIKHYQGKEVLTQFNVVEVKQKNEYKYTLFVRDISKQKKADMDKTGMMEEIMAKEFEYQKKIRDLESKLGEYEKTSGDEVIADKSMLVDRKEDAKEDKSAFAKASEDKSTPAEAKEDKSISAETTEDKSTFAEASVDKEEDKIFIEWQDDFSIDINSIDEQHRKLVEMINKLFSAFKQKKASELVQEIVFDLAEYTRYHFSYEEKYFKEFKYKDAESHISEHQLFVDKVAEFQQNIEDGEVKTPYEVMNFLRDWLLNHILKSDKKYSSLFKKKGLK